MHYTGTIHKCKFCTLYEDVPFEFLMSPLAEVEEDLKEISHVHRLLCPYYRLSPARM